MEVGEKTIYFSGIVHLMHGLLLRYPMFQALPDEIQHYLPLKLGY